MTYGAQRIQLFKEVVNDYNSQTKDLTTDNDILRVVLGMVLMMVGGSNCESIYGLPAIETDEELVLVEPFIDDKRFSTCTPQGNLYDYKQETVMDLFIHKAHSLSLTPAVYRINISTSAEYGNTFIFKGSKLSWKLNKEYILDA